MEYKWEYRGPSVSDEELRLRHTVPLEDLERPKGLVINHPDVKVTLKRTGPASEEP
ncbi:MAG TPA: hypothetical protein VG795_01170 [Acidimicrobiia bacterium]|nr:hypothetical protein [Acidimicrobiia bacterium]